MNHISLFRGIGLGLILAILGCGSGGTPKQTTESEVKRLGIVFGKFLGAHRGKAPANREELEQFIQAMPANERTVIGADNPAELFRSKRDGEEIVVRYGLTVPPPGKDPTVLAYEKKGVGGKHMVVYGTAGIDEITAARLKELVPDMK